MAALMANEFILNNEQRNISLDLQNIKEVSLTCYFDEKHIFKLYPLSSCQYICGYNS